MHAVCKLGIMSWRAAAATSASQATPPGARHMSLVVSTYHMPQVPLRICSIACQPHVLGAANLLLLSGPCYMTLSIAADPLATAAMLL